jgi:uncharacterized membrane protein
VSKQRRQRTGGADQRPRGETDRAQKRAQFEQPRRSTRLHLVAAGIVLALVTVSALAFVATRDDDATATATPTVAQGEDVRLPVAQFADGSARFFTYDAGGVQVKYFVLKSSDGTLRAAFDACDVCYASKKGYRQEGDEMVCNNCDQRFPSIKVNVLEGGCNPSPIERTVEGTDLVLKAADLQAGARFF